MVTKKWLLEKIGEPTETKKSENIKEYYYNFEKNKVIFIGDRYDCSVNVAFSDKLGKGTHSFKAIETKEDVYKVLRKVVCNESNKK